MWRWNDILPGYIGIGLLLLSGATDAMALDGDSDRIDRARATFSPPPKQMTREPVWRQLPPRQERTQREPLYKTPLQSQPRTTREPVWRQLPPRQERTQREPLYKTPLQSQPRTTREPVWRQLPPRQERTEREPLYKTPLQSQPRTTREPVWRQVPRQRPSDQPVVIKPPIGPGAAGAALVIEIQQKRQ